MKNCEMKLNGNILTITVDISKEFGVSSQVIMKTKKMLPEITIKKQ